MRLGLERSKHRGRMNENIIIQVRKSEGRELGQGSKHGAGGARGREGGGGNRPRREMFKAGDSAKF